MNPESHLPPTYKLSAVKWPGDIPAHWDVRRAKYFYREVDETSVTGLEELMSVSHKTGVTPRKSTVTMFMAESNVDYKICRPGDVVINTMWAYMAALGVARQVGVVSPSYGVYRPRSGSLLNSDYVDLLLRTEIYRAEYLRRSTGITSSRLRLYPDQFLGIPLLCPPEAEQTAIVRYLDRADDRIRRSISTKERLVELLTEQRQAVIHRAVTRGLDPDVRLKDSGVGWLGDVPAHWRVGHLRYFVDCLDGSRIPLSAEQRGLMQGKYPYWGANKVIDYVNDWLFDEPLVLLGEDGAPFFDPGRSVSFATSGKIWVNNHTHVLRCRRLINPKFLPHVLNCADYTQFITGSTRDKLTQQSMGNIPAQIPPLGEQAAIVHYLDKATAAIDDAIDKAQRQIDLLREYRTRLIADVVMGQVDVRGAIGDEAELPVS